MVLYFTDNFLDIWTCAWLSVCLNFRVNENGMSGPQYLDYLILKKIVIAPPFHEVFKMAAEKGERESRKQKRSESSVENHMDHDDDDDEPDFSDSEDYTDDISDEGHISICSKNFQYGHKNFRRHRQILVSRKLHFTCKDIYTQ